MAVPILQHSYALADSNKISADVAGVTVDGGTVNPLIVVMHNGPVNGNMNGATWNGETFTMVPGITAGAFWCAAAYLKPVSTGSHTLTATFPFFGNTFVLQVAVISGSVGVATTIATGADSSTLTTTADDSMVMDFVMSNVNAVHTQGVGQTQIQSTPQSTYRMSTSYKTVATSGTATTMSVSAAGATSWEMNTLEILSKFPVSKASNMFLVF